ncbi:MAG TPA: hypothetical protein VEH49_01465 [Methylomirabilota bacterium]|nr:hypothetical protein [Methylomirabilota bacterium]
MVDSKGRPIPNLAPSDFRAKMHGKPVGIASMVPDGRPRRIVILLDASGSMADSWGLALFVARNLIEVHLPDASFAMLIFAKGPVEQIGFDAGVKGVEKRLEEMEKDLARGKPFTKGYSAVFDSVLAALRMLGRADSADSIYLISDAADNASKASLRDAKRALVSSGTRLHHVFFPTPYGYRPTPEELNAPKDAAALVRASGGLAVEGPPRRTLSQQLSAHEMASFSSSLRAADNSVIQTWRIELEMPDASDKWREWELQFSDERGERFKGAKIIYPHELAPCTLPAR